MAQYNAGIIGLGFIGGADQVSGDDIGQKVPNLDGTHLVAYQNHDRVELIAGSSRDQGRRDRFTDRTGARTYEKWSDLIAKEELDVISIATYAPQHAEIAIACAEAGIKAIYSEKPIATTLEDADRMVAACEKAGSLLVLNHQKRFRLNHRRLRDYVADGKLGELTSVNLQWGNGRLGNVGTHMIDGLIMLTGRKVERVSANLDLAGKPDCRGEEFTDPGGWGTLIMEGNLRVTVDAADYATTPACITLNGTLGRAFVTPADDVRIVTYGVADQKEGSVKREATSEFWETAPSPSGMDRAVDEIVQYLDGTPFPYAVEEGRLTFETIVAMHASHTRNGAYVDLPLTDDDRLHEILSG
jgi:predicted dehydrogenase